ncbi:hypothetical protein Y032_0023g717 [Ancylostoma ceylanicum]|uniref:Uncharacterized protein n=1 Tax=Ancylostoma ceylanicum TaxID=53326 RepID=A0A016UXN9_9BILA|nr:hypothetical protein Y032_0023g717 [Ancylostoma ceylanicum]
MSRSQLLPSHLDETRRYERYSELRTAAEKGRDSGEAFLGTDTEALHAGSGCLLLSAAENSSASPRQTTRASMHSPCVSAQRRRAAVSPLVYTRLEFNVFSLPMLCVSA